MRPLLVVLIGLASCVVVGCGSVSGGPDGGGGHVGGRGGHAGDGAGGSAGASGGTAGATGPACGPVLCDVGMVCCNAGCGICTLPGGACVAGCPAGGASGGSGSPGAGGTVASGGAGGDGATGGQGGGRGGSSGNAGLGGGGGTSAGAAGDGAGMGGAGGHAAGGDAGASHAECTQASDCVLHDDCCTCAPVPKTDLGATCNIECVASRCASLRISSADVTCVAGRCVFARSCNAKDVACTIASPACAAGSLPIVTGVCYSGGCLPAAQCSDVASCGVCKSAGLACVTDQQLGGPIYHCVTVPSACSSAPTCQCLGVCNGGLQCTDPASTSPVCDCPAC